VIFIIYYYLLLFIIYLILQKYKLKGYVELGKSGLDVDLELSTPLYGGHVIVYPISSPFFPLYLSTISLPLSLSYSI
jgi:hypothetical protein